MTEREQFEAWHIEHVGRKPMLDTPSGHWVDDKKAFSAWQASRRAALEEAWAICNANAAKLKGPKETASGYVALVLTADDIRALVKETNNV